eukprot:1295729-Amphidinium_carterae.1
MAVNYNLFDGINGEQDRSGKRGRATFQTREGTRQQLIIRGTISLSEQDPPYQSAARRRRIQKRVSETTVAGLSQETKVAWHLC